MTKGFSAQPEIVSAMLRGGIEKLADARLENVIRLRQHGFTQHVTLLRIPMLSQAKRVVEYCDCRLNSEIEVIRALSAAALEQGKRHDTIEESAQSYRVGDMIELHLNYKGMLRACSSRYIPHVYLP